MERNEATSMTERLARALDAHIEGPDRLTMEDAIALRDELRRLSADARMLDWLEQSRCGFYNLDRVTSIVGHGFSANGAVEDAPWNPSLRAAIDQAMDGK